MIKIMKMNLNRVMLTLTSFILLFCFFGCKKEKVIDYKPNAQVEIDTPAMNLDLASVSSYTVSTLVSGLTSSFPIVSKVQYPFRICSSADGTLYVSAPNAGGLLYKISQQGKVTRLPNLDSPYGIKAGENGAIYMTSIKFSSDIPSLVKLDRNNVFTTIPVSVGLSHPLDLAIAPDSSIYIADELNNRIVKVTKQGISSVFAGKTGQKGTTDGKGGNARFTYPTNIRYANDGTLWVVDGSGTNQSIRKITLDGTVSTFFKMSAIPDSYINDLAVTNKDKDFKISPHENAFISITRSSVHDTSSLTQRRYQILHLAYNKVLTPITSLSLEGFQDGDAAQATFRGPTGLTVKPEGIFVADLSNNAIRKITKN